MRGLVSSPPNPIKRKRNSQIAEEHLPLVGLSALVGLPFGVTMGKPCQPMSRDARMPRRRASGGSPPTPNCQGRGRADGDCPLPRSTIASLPMPASAMASQRQDYYTLEVAGAGIPPLSRSGLRTFCPALQNNDQDKSIFLKFPIRFLS